MPLADLKRQHSQRQRVAARAETLEARLACAARLIAHYPEFVPTFLLSAALSDPADCPLCVSPYSDCQVHR